MFSTWLYLSPADPVQKPVLLSDPVGTGHGDSAAPFNRRWINPVIPRMSSVAFEGYNDSRESRPRIGDIDAPIGG
jgi:hypothetical protein